MFKPIHASLATLFTLLAVTFACQSGDAPGDVKAQGVSAEAQASLVKKGSSPYELVVAYSTNNDGEIDPCG